MGNSKIKNRIPRKGINIYSLVALAIEQPPKAIEQFEEKGISAKTKVAAKVALGLPDKVSKIVLT